MDTALKQGDVLYIDSGDDHEGGLAIVDVVYLGMSAGEMIPFVIFKGMYGSAFNVDSLLKKQPRLRAFFKSCIACQDIHRDRQGNPLRDILEPRVFDETAYHKLEQENEHLWTG